MSDYRIYGKYRKSIKKRKIILTVMRCECVDVLTPFFQTHLYTHMCLILEYYINSFIYCLLKCIYFTRLDTTQM